MPPVAAETRGSHSGSGESSRGCFLQRSLEDSLGDPLEDVSSENVLRGGALGCCFPKEWPRRWSMQLCMKTWWLVWWRVVQGG